MQPIDTQSRMGRWYFSHVQSSVDNRLRLRLRQIEKYGHISTGKRLEENSRTNNINNFAIEKIFFFFKDHVLQVNDTWMLVQSDLSGYPYCALCVANATKVC